ncbi:MAG: hypothetical protein AB1347_00330 [Acidobacteriota bacterium]
MSRRTWVILVLAAVLPLWFAAQQLAGFRYTLRHRDVRSVVGRVTEELGPRGRITVEGAGNSLSVEDEVSRLPGIRRLLRDLDAPARRFALEAALEVLPRTPAGGLFKQSQAFVDATEWSASERPEVTHRGVIDLREGGGGECALGKDFRLEAEAQGFDPSRRRLGLRSLKLSWRPDAGDASKDLLRGAAVLPEGEPTLFLLRAKEEIPPLRLRITPTLLPDVARPEVP